MREPLEAWHKPRAGFPFLFGGTFIEGHLTRERGAAGLCFPSFSEGLSLRDFSDGLRPNWSVFPFLFGGTFIEGMMSLPNH